MPFYNECDWWLTLLSSSFQFYRCKPEWPAKQLLIKNSADCLYLSLRSRRIGKFNVMKKFIYSYAYTFSLIINSIDAKRKQAHKTKVKINHHYACDQIGNDFIPYSKYHTPPVHELTSCLHTFTLFF